MMYIVMIAAGLYVANLWWSDLKAHKNGADTGARPLPGARPAPRAALLIAAAGALVILAAETIGEAMLGLTEEQSEMTVLFGCYTLIAAIIEEIIFRGYILIENRGRAALIGSVLAASLLFALLHPFLWSWDMGKTPLWQIVMVWRWPEWLTLTLTPKGWFSFGAVWISSLWFYTCRLASWNPQRSLLPCFAAHAAKNAGVFVIKAAQGFVVGFW